MLHSRKTRQILGTGIGIGLVCLPANALVRWNEGKEQVFVNATVSVLLDSNIYSSADRESDVIYSATVGMEYRRQAGMIGINADMNLANGRFGKNTDENYLNPNLHVELTKDTGRTTGTMGFSAMRASRADPAANIRTDSWNYGTELHLKYPISERHSLSAGLSWGRRDYQNNATLVDADTSTFSADWFYVYTPERDIFGGYRLRVSDTTALTRYADHSISAGVSGRIIPKVNGTARIGYQVRKASGSISETYSGYNASVTATWNISKRVSIVGNVSKDFSVTSTDISTDAITADAHIQYARSAKLSFIGGVGWGNTKFLGVLGNGREDTFVSADARVQYVFSERLRIGLSYSYFKNWSTQSFGDFDRHAFTFDASSRF